LFTENDRLVDDAFDTEIWGALDEKTRSGFIYLFIYLNRD